MILFNDKYRIESSRLRGFDYSTPGAYFVTICTKNHVCVFGEIAGGKMILNETGKTASKYWHEISDHFPSVALDAFVVMPDHVHGIIRIMDDPHIRAVFTIISYAAIWN
jgi:putative transposase